MFNLKKSTVKITVLMVVLLIIYTHAYFSDIRSENNANILNKETCVNCDVTDNERIKIENVIKNYKEIKSLKKSKRKNILTEIVLSSARGGIAGAVLGGEAAAISGMIVFGSISGILTWARYYLPTSSK
jgi:hypothetical protein